jgi:hypothetical protein
LVVSPALLGSDENRQKSRKSEITLRRLRAMLRDRQEILAVGELALFLATWFATLWAAVDHFRGNDFAGNSIASSSRIERSLEKLD